MNDLIEKIDTLNLALFETIPSQTSVGDKRSLLAVQRAYARKYKEYTYLEIGSHLGGTIQPYLVDDQCKKIYSIDPRPSQQPDDRSSGYVAYYTDNSAERMLALLSGISYGDVSKIENFKLDASQVEPKRITSSPQIVLIDGEHTKTAVLSDFHFCSKVVGKDGAILFHDFSTIYPGIQQICRLLDEQHRTYLPVKLEDNVFGIFFNPDIVHSDLYLTSLYKSNSNFFLNARLKKWLKRVLPYPLLRVGSRLRNRLRRKNTAETLRGRP